MMCYSCDEDVCARIIALCFFFQAEDGIRDLVRSRGLGDVYKRQRGLGSDTRGLEWQPRAKDARA